MENLNEQSTTTSPGYLLSGHAGANRSSVSDPLMLIYLWWVCMDKMSPSMVTSTWYAWHCNHYFRSDWPISQVYLGFSGNHNSWLSMTSNSDHQKWLIGVTIRRGDQKWWLAEVTIRVTVRRNHQKWWSEVTLRSCRYKWPLVLTCSTAASKLGDGLHIEPTSVHNPGYYVNQRYWCLIESHRSQWCGLQIGLQRNDNSAEIPKDNVTPKSYAYWENIIFIC